MEFFKVVSVEEAKKVLMDNFKGYEFETEEIGILESIDRILAGDIYSNINVPEFNRSTVDGYAIKVSDSHGANDSMPSILDILGEIMMGEESDLTIKSGEAIYIPTGGMIPQGSDGVIMIENTEKMDEDTILIYRPISQGENIIYKGEDIQKDDLALKKGRKITPEVIGVLAALGIQKPKVYKKPRFFIISTGDEIIDLDEELTIGNVRDINAYTLSALIEKIGGEVVGKSIIKDNYNLLRSEIERVLKDSDIILISGGSSVGARDYTHKVIDSFDGKGVFVHGVSIKPGKPTIIGEANGKLVCGLPGHPVSAIIVFNTFIEYYINKKLGVKNISPKIDAIMDFNFPSSPGRATYQMVKLSEKEGVFYATPSFGRSGMISLLSESKGYIIIEDYEEGVYKGESRRVFLL